MRCLIFRCSRKDEMYLYLPYQEDEAELIKSLPEDLLNLTGHLEKTLALDLTIERKLARVKTEGVLNALEDKGYYLQMPPNAVFVRDESMLNDSSDGF